MRFLGSNGDYYADSHFCEYTAVKSGRSVASYRRNLLPPSSGYTISTFQGGLLPPSSVQMISCTLKRPSALMIDEATSSGKSLQIYSSTRRYIQKDITLHFD